MKQITRSEYNDALDIIEAYHTQLFSTKHTPSKTLILEWHKLSLCSVRLVNVLRRISHIYKGMYIEDVNRNTFRLVNGAGMRSLSELEEIRGY